MAQTKAIEKKDFLSIALQYHSWGLRPIPIDEKKIPQIPRSVKDGKWGSFQKEQTEADVRTLFSVKCVGIAILTGVGGLEVIDLDLKYDITDKLLTDLMAYCYNAGLDFQKDFTVITTPSGGFHFLYRCEKIEGNKKLAMRPGTPQEMISHKDEVEAHNSQLSSDQNKGRRKEEKPRVLITDPDQLPKVLIETRGKGGYIGTVPGPGYSLDVGSLEHIPTLTVDQRDTLINCCKAFNQVIKYSQKSKVDRKIYSLHQRKGGSFEGKPSWEAYHEKSDPVALLTERGWVISHENPAQIFLRRPGKSQGWSADYHKDRKILAVWTTSTNLEDKHYSPFALYTELVHNGDFRAAAKQLYKEGYGDRQTGDQVQPAEGKKDQPRVGTVQDPARKGGPALDLQTLVQKAEKTRFDYSAPIRNIKACVKLKGLDGTTRKMASFGPMRS